MVNNPDQEILQLVSKGSMEAGFSLLVRTYQEKLYWQIRRMVAIHADADDVLQNTFVKVYKNILKFEGNAKLSTWLYRIAVNESISFLKAKKRKRTEDIEGVHIETRLIQDSYFDHETTLLNLQKAIHMLPEKQRAVFTMRYYNEMPYKEMAEVMGGTVGSLKASYHHAVKKIEEYLKINISYVGG